MGHSQPHFHSFQPILFNRIVDISGIRTRIIRVKCDHLTTTTTAPVVKRVRFTCCFVHQNKDILSCRASLSFNARIVQRIKYPYPSKFDRETSISDCDLKKSAFALRYWRDSTSSTKYFRNWIFSFARLWKIPNLLMTWRHIIKLFGLSLAFSGLISQLSQLWVGLTVPLSPVWQITTYCLDSSNPM